MFERAPLKVLSQDRTPQVYDCTQNCLFHGSERGAAQYFAERTSLYGGDAMRSHCTSTMCRQKCLFPWNLTPPHKHEVFYLRSWNFQAHFQYHDFTVLLRYFYQMKPICLQADQCKNLGFSENCRQNCLLLRQRTININI